MKVIAHRGVRGPYTENSLRSFEAATQTKADAVEFDIQATKDGQLVVLHTMGSPKKVFGITKPINNLTWAEVKKYRSPDGERMPTFDEVIAVLKNKPVDIDIKDLASARALAELLSPQQAKHVAVVNSLYPEALRIIQRAYPELKLSLQNYKHPLRAVNQARDLGFSHVTLPLYLVNPLTYAVARARGIHVLTYQNYASFLLNWRWFVVLMQTLYPKITVISDRADKVAR
jgi:glycerophosphoryl diester phosphodiesterase